MMRLRLEEHLAPRWFTLVIPAVAVILTFLLTSLFFISSGADPINAFGYLLFDPLATRFGQLEVLVTATPLLLTGIAVAWAFRAGYYNIGAEGQLLAGAIAAAWIGTHVDDLPVPLALAMMVVGGMAAGALWALIPALLRVRFGIDEVVTTLLLNPVALLLVTGLLNGPWRNPETGFPESERIAAGAEFPQIVERSRLHLGFFIAVIVVAIGWFVSSKTTLGLKLRSAGLSPHGARFAGINVTRMLMIAALGSGAIAGIAGVSEIAGIQFRLTEGVSPGYGYTGIVVATLGALSMVGVAAAALFLALLSIGADTVSRALDVPSQLGTVVQSTLLLVTVSLLVLRRFRIKLTRAGP
jgi:general nucleoside transport system permease protein